MGNRHGGGMTKPPNHTSPVVLSGPKPTALTDLQHPLIPMHFAVGSVLCCQNKMSRIGTKITWSHCNSSAIQLFPSRHAGMAWRCVEWRGICSPPTPNATCFNSQLSIELVSSKEHQSSEKICTYSFALVLPFYHINSRTELHSIDLTVPPGNCEFATS